VKDALEIKAKSTTCRKQTQSKVEPSEGTPAGFLSAVAARKSLPVKSRHQVDDILHMASRTDGNRMSFLMKLCTWRTNITKIEQNMYQFHGVRERPKRPIECMKRM
jgi:hypothetical protein